MLFLHEKLSLFLVQKTEIVWNKNLGIKKVWSLLNSLFPCFRGGQSWKTYFCHSFQANGGTALDFIFHSKPRTAAFLLREAGERHAKKIAKMQIQQVWALWQIGSGPQYSLFNFFWPQTCVSLAQKCISNHRYCLHRTESSHPPLIRGD